MQLRAYNKGGGGQGAIQNNRTFHKIFCYRCKIPPPPLSNLCRSPCNLLYTLKKNKLNFLQLYTHVIYFCVIKNILNYPSYFSASDEKASRREVISSLSLINCLNSLVKFHETVHLPSKKYSPLLSKFLVSCVQGQNLISEGD